MPRQTANYIPLQRIFEELLRSRIESTVSRKRVKLTRIEIKPGNVEFWITFLAAYEFVSNRQDLERKRSEMMESVCAIIQTLFSEAGIHDLRLGGPPRRA
jgi:hypothetical protein